MWYAPRNNTAEVFSMWYAPSNNTEAVFSMWPMPKDYKKSQNNREVSRSWEAVSPGEFSSVREDVKKRVSLKSAAVKRRIYV
jgi:hypothetical protein